MARAQKWRIAAGDQGRVKNVSALDPAIKLDAASGANARRSECRLVECNGSDAQPFHSFRRMPAFPPRAGITPGYELSSVVDPTRLI